MRQLFRKKNHELTDVRIYKTTDFGAFKLIEGNRDIKKGHLKLLIKSIQENNLLEFNPILINEDREVIDGQHRLEAAKQLKTPIYYIILVGGRILEVVAFNTNKRNWSPENYLDLYVKRGNSNYITIKEFVDTYHLSISSTLILLCPRKSRRTTELAQSFKDGSFVAEEPTQAREVGEKLLDYYPLIPHNVYVSREFIRAMVEMHAKNSYEHGVMVRKLTSKGMEMVRSARIKDIYSQLENIYNFGNSKRVRIY